MLIRKIKSFAKLNVFLNIISRRNDGYHNIISVFLPISLHDEIEIYSSLCFNIEFENANIKIEESTVFKAIKFFYEKLAKPIPKLFVRINKKIPIGGGLGGGSSNAAYVLKFLNEYNNYPFSTKELIDIAVKIGMDVPFFIYSQPAIVMGRGEKIFPFSLDYKLYGVLFSPSFSINTKEAYSLFKNYSFMQKVENLNMLKKMLKEKNFEKEIIGYNDFENVIFPKYKELEDIKQKLAKFCPNILGMSGSGSCMYALFVDEVQAHQCFENINVNAKKYFIETIGDKM